MSIAKDSPTQQLASLKLGRPLEEYVAEKRAAGLPWSSIAVEISIDTDGAVNISRESLRLWYAPRAVATLRDGSQVTLSSPWSE